MKSMMTRSVPAILMIGLMVLGVPSAGFGLTVNTSTQAPELQGVEMTLEFMLVPTGVNQEAESPLDRSSVKIGESVDLGKLSKVPNKPAQLRVQLPDGTFYNSVRPREIESGTIDLVVHPHGPVEQLEVEEHSVLVQPFPKRLMVREIVVFNNRSNHRVGGENEPIGIDIPAGASRVNPGPGFSGESDYRVSNGMLNYRVQLPPGRSIIGFFYIIKPGENRYKMARSPNWDTNRFKINTMTSDGVTVSTEGLEKMSTNKNQERSGPDQYVAENVSAGTVLSMTWSGLSDMEMPGQMSGNGSRAPRSSAPDQPQGSSGSNQSRRSRPNVFSSVSWPVFIGIGISFIVFAGSYGYVQFHLKSDQSGDHVDFLVEEIARLDQEFEDGAIDEPFYKRTRRRWKERAESIRSSHDSSNQS